MRTGYEDCAELDFLREVHERKGREDSERERFGLSHLEELYGTGKKHPADGSLSEKDAGGRRAERASGRRLLRRWGAAEDYCRRLQRRARSLRALIDEARWNSPEPGPGVQNPNPSDPTYNEVRHLEEIRARYGAELERITGRIERELELSEAVEDCVSRLSPVKRQIIELRYREKRSWISAALEAELSEQHAKRLEGSALDDLAGEPIWRGLWDAV